MNKTQIIQINKKQIKANFIYYAQTNKAFVKSLSEELNFLGVKTESMINLNTQRLNYLKFSCSQNILWKIMLHSRLIEGLKIQIGDKFKARDEKELKISLKRIEYEKFLPMSNSLEYKVPTIKAYSFRSNLFHEKMLENIMKTTLNKLAYEVGNKNDVRLKINEKDEDLYKKLEKRKQLKELPRIDLIIQKDKGQILLSLLNNPLHMHGYKNQINWGSLRETYACAILYESKILEKFNQSNKLFIWDPFCGSGTILIELFLLVTERHIRPLEDFSKEAFTFLPFHNHEEFKNFIKEEQSETKDKTILFKNESTEIQLLASDIDAKSIDSLVKNAVKADLNSYTVKIGELGKKFNENLTNVNLQINPTMFHEKINNVMDTFIGDFEVIAKDVVFNKNLTQFSKNKFTLMSNIPYGTSHEMSDKLQIKSLYRRFGKFIRKHSHLIDDVYILVNKRDDKDELNFKYLTESKWKVLCQFDNNGIEVEFLKWQRDIL